MVRRQDRSTHHDRFHRRIPARCSLECCRALPRRRRRQRRGSPLPDRRVIAMRDRLFTELGHSPVLVGIASFAVTLMLIAAGGTPLA